MDKGLKRCTWAGDDELYCRYHDEEWGIPVHDDKRLFEMLCLEGAQAGLSWITILRKRENYRRAFDGFDIDKILKYDDDKLDALMQDAGIVRNRLKIQSVVTNAKAFRAVQEKHGSFDSFLWSYVGGTPICNNWNDISEVPAQTELSDRISKDLKKRGFKFVGSTIVYAYMQSVGMVNDHVCSCSFRSPNRMQKKSSPHMILNAAAAISSLNNNRSRHAPQMPKQKTAPETWMQSLFLFIAFMNPIL